LLLAGQPTVYTEPLATSQLSKPFSPAVLTILLVHSLVDAAQCLNPQRNASLVAAPGPIPQTRRMVASSTTYLSYELFLLSGAAGDSHYF
jgi:hypothetical protein